MSIFCEHAANKIRHIGGSIFYESDKSWRDSHGQQVVVPSFDLKTVGFIGWPTIRALMDAGVLYHRRGNEYSLTASEQKRAA